MSNPRQKLGAWGEEMALRRLQRKGDVLLARRIYRTTQGELDLVTRRGQSTVFVEVKTRRSGCFGPPQASVTEAKQAHLIASAQAFLAEHPEHDGDWQIDVIAIRVFKDGPPCSSTLKMRSGGKYPRDPIPLV